MGKKKRTFLYKDALSSAIDDGKKFGVFVANIVLQPQKSFAKLSPEETTSQAVDEKAERCIEGHEQTGDIGEDDKPKWRIETGNLVLRDDLFCPADDVIVRHEVGQVVEGEHVLKLDLYGSNFIINWQPESILPNIDFTRFLILDVEIQRSKRTKKSLQTMAQIQSNKKGLVML